MFIHCPNYVHRNPNVSPGYISGGLQGGLVFGVLLYFQKFLCFLGNQYVHCCTKSQDGVVEEGTPYCGLRFVFYGILISRKFVNLSHALRNC